MLPMMSAGGWPALTMDFMAVVAGVRWTTVPSAMVTVRWVRGGAPEVARAEATAPMTTMKTAIPRTMRAGPRVDTG